MFFKNVIIDTTVVSGHWKSDSSNFTSTDKLYFLSSKEIYSNWSKIEDSAKDVTRRLDYYKSKNVTTSSHSDAIKQLGNVANSWGLRSANSSYDYYFLSVSTSGGWESNYANSSHGVSPAFRIG